MTEPPTGQASSVDGVALGASEPETDRADLLEPYRRWATVCFSILAAVGILGSVVVLGAIPVPPVVVLLLAAVVIGVGALLVVVAALRRPASWAVHAIAPICYVIVVAGLIRVMAALSQNTFTLPLEVIGALLVLTRDHRADHLPSIDEGGRRRVWWAVGAVVVAQVLPHAAGPIANGSLFGAGRQALDLQVAIDCTAAAEPGGEIDLRTAWSWRATEMFSQPIDGLVIQWNILMSDTDDPSGGGTVNDRVSTSHPAIWSGGGGPASALIQPLIQETPSREFGIDVGTAGLIDGSVVLGLRPADPAARHGSLQAWAAYAHGDRWLQQSATTACSW